MIYHQQLFMNCPYVCCAVQDLDLPPPSHLPWDVLVLILQHVDLPQRLSSGATVNSAWHAATLAATHTILHRSVIVRLAYIVCHSPLLSTF